MGLLFLNLPFIGVRRILIDAAGLACAGVVLTYWIVGSSICTYAILIPRYYSGELSWFSLSIFAWISFCTLVSFINASTSDPGIIAQPQATWSFYANNYFQQPKPTKSLDEMLQIIEGLDDFPDNTEAGGDGVASGEADSSGSTSVNVNAHTNVKRTSVEYCEKCFTYRPKRSHHCRRCGHCVRKMDHHCPWINNCVGGNNQWLFINLVVYAFLMSLCGLILVVMEFTTFSHPGELPNGTNVASPTNFAAVYRETLLIVLACMSALMSTSMVAMSFSQIQNVMYDVTTLERMRETIDAAMASDADRRMKLMQAHSRGEAAATENSNSSAREAMRAIVNGMSVPQKVGRRRRPFCSAFQIFCGSRRPRLLWLVPMPLCWPPPPQSVSVNVYYKAAPIDPHLAGAAVGQC